MTPNNAPIGIYDSGLGGLAVWKTIRDRLPQERVIYYADTAHVPYGGKSAEEIMRFSRDIINRLLLENVKLIVVACNTSSAIALPELATESPAPLIGMIEPSVYEAVQVSRSGRIGLLATEGTVRSAAHARMLARKAPGSVLVGQACPALVPLIEAGGWSGSEMRAAVEQYVKPLLRERVDCIILGCTHYPLIREHIQAAAGGVVLIDPAVAVAEQVAAMLEQSVGTHAGKDGEDAVYVSGDPASFTTRAQELGFTLPAEVHAAQAMHLAARGGGGACIGKANEWRW